ncbi:hypothetical protein PR001_g25769 [Phytophthora rubi]|uniref:BZIP domain-containing protein n=1 Tax=Phytophthora rubi TaxID=129364 RepID=A0A6A3HX98_9STRA|nr:hypothetical protein PR001_g25769 [Phytophthora rubi]
MVESVKSKPTEIAKRVAIKAEPCEQKSPVKLLLSPVDTNEGGDGQLSADQLKKRRRNARDRKCSFAKRETMERMRKTVAALELQKQQLMEHVVASSPRRSNSSSIPTEQSAAPSFWSNQSSTSVTRADYVQLAAGIEEFRRQNAAMGQELARRDLFNNSLRYRLASFSPLTCRGGTQPTQFTHAEGVACVRQTLEIIHDARQRYASEERFHNRPTFLGWSQYAERQGGVVTFGVKKLLRNVTPQQLMDRTWQLQTNEDNLQRLGPSHLRTHITLLQKISDDILIIDRHTEDQSRTDRRVVLRTVYVLFRISDADDSHTLGIKTLELPKADRMLWDDEVWWDIFYWIHVSPANCAAQDVATVTEFGGANSCTCEDLASSRLKELIFLVVRWETLAVAPFLLQQ